VVRGGDRSRRSLGALVIVVVLLAVFVVARTRDSGVAGLATALPIPGPPAAGQCLQQHLTGLGAETTQNNQPLFPTVAIGGCSGLHQGEVVAVVNHRLPLPADALTAFTPYDQWCSTAVNTWTGDDSKGPMLDPFNQTWRLQYAAAGGVLSVLSGPDQRQQAAGQFWVACIAVPQLPDGSSNATGAYAGSIRGGFTRVPAPPGLAWCQGPQTLSSTATPVDCNSRHRAEVVGHKLRLATPDHPLDTPAAEQQSCLLFASRVTGMTDPTAGGRLVVTAQTQPVDPADRAAAPNELCLITSASPQQYLNGPLLGLGRQPLPLR
jgi:hypothetical protein